MAALREDIFGWEFNFLVVDQDGCLALFSSAGYGDIPPQALDFPFAREAPVLSELPDSEQQLLAALTSDGTAKVEGRGVGEWTTWLELGKRGLFVYDWLHYDGPYERLVIPNDPLTFNQLPSDLHKLIVLRLPVSFAKASVLANILTAPTALNG